MAWRSIGPACVYNGQLGYDSTGRDAVSGRVTCIAPHPTNPEIVYVGTAGGGVWRTEDDGKTWKPLMDQSITMAVGAMAFHPDDPSVLYVATGEGNDGGMIFYGHGIHIYHSGLEQWTQIFDVKLKFERTSALELFKTAPGDPNVHILVGNTVGLLYSPDDGVNVQQVNLPGHPGLYQRITAIVHDVSSGVPATFRTYVGAFRDGIYRRIGHNSAFQKLPMGGSGQLPNPANLSRIALANCKAHPQALYAALGDTDSNYIGMWRSLDGGDIWHECGKPWHDPKQTNYDFVVTVHPELPKIVFLGATRLWKSEDFGISWTRVNEPGQTQGIHADQHALVYSPGNTSKIWAGNDGGVWLSTDGGETWRPRNRGLATMQYYSLAHHPKHDTLLLVGAQDNGTQRYEGGPSWNLVGFGDGFFVAIDHQNPNRWYSSYVFQPDASSDSLKAIYRSTESGAPGSFSLIVDGISPDDTTDRDPFYVPFIIDPVDSKVLYLATSRLYRWDDANSRWDAIQIKKADGTLEPFTTGNQRVNAITAICVNPNDNTIVYVGTYDGNFWCLKRQPEGHWTATQKNPPAPAGVPLQYVGDIASPKSDTAAKQHVVYLGVGSPHSSGVLYWQNAPPCRIFRSDADGDAWTALYQPALDLNIQGQALSHSVNPVNAVAIRPSHPEHVYIGCNLGVFFSHNEGQDWTPVRNGLPNTPISDLVFNNDGSLLRAATMGRSVWEASNLPAGAPQAGLVYPTADPAKPDIYVRDNITDAGRPITPETTAHPLRAEAQTIWADCIDLKIDTPFPVFGGFQDKKSTTNYEPDGPADYVAFANFTDDKPRRDKTSRIYVQIHNRGPEVAEQVAVRVFYSAKLGNGYPDLPAGFWALALADNQADAFPLWKPVGTKAPPGSIRVGQAGVFEWEFKTPGDIQGSIGFLVVASSAGDPLNVPAGDLEVKKVVREHKYVALKEVEVGTPDSDYVVAAILILAGVALLTGAIVSAATSSTAAEPV